MTVIDTELTLDTWLDLVTQPESEEARLWHPGWSDAATPVRSIEHLTVLVSSLDPEGDFAGVTVPGYRRWVQIKRLDARCWVEGQAKTGDWPWVFLPREPSCVVEDRLGGPAIKPGRSRGPGSTDGCSKGSCGCRPPLLEAHVCPPGSRR